MRIVLARYLVRGASTTVVMVSPAWERTASFARMAQAAAVAAFRRLARARSASTATGAGPATWRAAAKPRQLRPLLSATAGAAWFARAGGYRRHVRSASGDVPAHKGPRVNAFLGIWAVALGLAVALAGCSGGAAHRQAAAPGRVSRTAAPPGGGLSPAQAWAAYDLGPLLRAGINGKGQTIAVVDPFGSPTIARDVAVFDKRFGLPSLSLRVIQPAGAVPRYRPTQARTSAAGGTTL